MVPGPTDQVGPKVIPLLQAKGYTVIAVQNPLTSLKCVAYLGGNPQLLLAPNSGRARHLPTNHEALDCSNELRPVDSSSLVRS